MSYRSVNESTQKHIYIEIIIAILVLIAGCILVKIGIDFGKEEKIEYSYEVTKSDNYEMLLKPNIFYETETLPANRYYASKSIDKCVIDLKYDFKGAKETTTIFIYPGY